jgi:hypothetical protein
MFLKNMTKPRHGKLFLNDTGQWVFCPGTSRDTSTGIVLHDLPSTCEHLMDTGQLFKGHAKFQRVYNARNQIQLQDSIHESYR